MVLGAQHGGQRALARAAGVSVVHQGAIHNRPDVGHEGMVQHALAKTGGVDDAGLGIADGKAPHPADLDRAVEQGFAQAGQLAVQIGAE